jgi:hypothetical protein
MKGRSRNGQNNKPQTSAGSSSGAKTLWELDLSDKTHPDCNGLHWEFLAAYLKDQQLAARRFRLVICG